VVDDDLQICRTTKIILESESWEVLTFDSAESCWKQFSKATPDIVIMDYQLPGKSGPEFLDTMRHEAQGVEVIIITGIGDEDTAVQVMRNGERNCGPHNTQRELPKP